MTQAEASRMAIGGPAAKRATFEQIKAAMPGGSDRRPAQKTDGDDAPARIVRPFGRQVIPLERRGVARSRIFRLLVERPRRLLRIAIGLS